MAGATPCERNSSVQAKSQDIVRGRPSGIGPVLARLSGSLAPLSFLLLLSILLTLTTPNFASHNNLKQIAIQAAVVAILACGQTAVIVAGHIDLSVGAMMALSGVVAGQSMHLYHVNMWVAVFAACVCGIVTGVLNGLITAYGKISAFIVTLGMMGLAYGTGSILANSQNVFGFSPGFDVFGTGELFGNASTDGIPYAILIMALVAVTVFVAMSRSSWGRKVYAMGGNREAARLSGVPLNRVTISVFALSGLLAGIAAVVNVSRISVAEYKAGSGYELYAVAATVIGGTSLAGGQGGIPGTILGALLMYTIINGCDLHGLGSDYQRAIIGAVVIIAVLYDRHCLPWLRGLLAGTPRRTA
jgi:ribose/xylose/arabinose/galactoside ABC-type transport system permease subunit